LQDFPAYRSGNPSSIEIGGRHEAAHQVDGGAVPQSLVERQ
jgi:hypothetical protein